MVIGVTGNSGTGKTLICNFWEQWGASIISADKIGWEVLREPKVREEIKRTFGRRIAGEETINRKKIGEIVFKNKEKLELFNSIVHPVLLERLKESIENCKEDIVVVDVALIVEWGIQDWFDYLILIDSREEVKRLRLKRLGVPEDAISGRLNSQVKPSKAKEFADFVIKNNGSVTEVRKKTREIWNKIIEFP
ncbi:MAG: dephospho-CoA kinase [candidate division WOR-3 bacterium]|nr:dephospho-CoA kinase [candidate division WOR-3 bacterium]